MNSTILSLNGWKKISHPFRPAGSLFVAKLNRGGAARQRGNTVGEECRNGTALIELPSVFTSRGFLYLYFRSLPAPSRFSRSLLCNSRLSRRKSGIKRARVGKREASGCFPRSGRREDGEMVRKRKRTRKNRLVRGKGKGEERKRDSRSLSLLKEWSF